MVEPWFRPARYLDRSDPAQGHFFVTFSLRMIRRILFRWSSRVRDDIAVFVASPRA